MRLMPSILDLVARSRSATKDVVGAEFVDGFLELGPVNAGRPITEARDEAVAKGVTINGLAILSKVPLATNPLHTNPYGGLTAYYENNVMSSAALVRS